MDLVQRAKNIVLTPQTEWPVIASETTPSNNLVTGYVVPLAAVSAVAAFIGQVFVGVSVPFVGTVRIPIVNGLVGAVLAIVMAVVLVYVLAAIINALAPTFNTEKNKAQAFKVAVYSITPVWIAGILNIIPALGLLGILAALYGIYLMYLGLRQVMKSPDDKAVAYTAIVAISCLVVMIVLGAVTATVAGIGTYAGGGITGLGRSPAATAQVDPNSPLGKLESFGKAMEDSAKKMEAAQKSGDANAQVTAALEGLGTLFGGGKRVNPIEIDQLKTFVPETFGGMPKTSTSAEKTGLPGLMVSTVEARYSDGQRTIELELIDTGGVSGLVGIAAWAGAMSEKEDDEGFERTRKEGDRIVHEKGSKRAGGTNEFALVLAGRFVVTAKANGVELNDLKNAVASLDLAKLESMKDAGGKD
ncbi:MAG TPA: Yip1 family protein [Vicinamibacterales bacterium]|nr:Yip1 family protein [Vicinamibacterales bacterium]